MILDFRIAFGVDFYALGPREAAEHALWWNGVRRFELAKMGAIDPETGFVRVGA